MPTVDFDDTFLDLPHVKETFPNSTVTARIDAGGTIGDSNSITTVTDDDNDEDVSEKVVPPFR